MRPLDPGYQDVADDSMALSKRSLSVWVRVAIGVTATCLVD